jgi:hypothetical protein
MDTHHPPPSPPPEAEIIWEAWSPHLAHEGKPAPYDSTARNLFLGVLTSSPSNVGELTELMNLLSLYVQDTIRTETLRAHTVGTQQEEDMPQSSSKRGREDPGDTEDTGASYRRTQPTVPPQEGQPPPADPPGVTPVMAPGPGSPRQTREAARLAFLADHLLPLPEQLQLQSVEALLALQVGGEWAAAALRLLALPLPKPKATATWKAWKTHLTHPPYTRPGRPRWRRPSFRS